LICKHGQAAAFHIVAVDENPRFLMEHSKELQVGMAGKAKLKSSRLDANVLAWDGEFKSSGL